MFDIDILLKGDKILWYSDDRKVLRFLSDRDTMYYSIVIQMIICGLLRSGIEQFELKREVNV